MDKVLEDFQERYLAAMLEYLDRPAEKGLEVSYQLGRDAMNERLGSLDIAKLHHDALTRALLSAAGPSGVLPAERIEEIMERATTFRLESLSTFEIMQRGYFEAQQLYESERNVADSLRESLLPHSLPAIPGIEVEAYYRAGGSGNQIGGDFYDLFELGRDQWGVLLGDVCGKGAAAAAITAMARHTAKTAVLLETHPGAVLDLVNRAFLSFGADYFCTMIHGRIDRTSSGVEMSFATGGHPHPFVLTAEGNVSKVGVEGPLLGVLDDWAATPATFQLKPGEAIVLYTDGVTEARLPDGFFGEEGLVAALENCGGHDAPKIVATLLDALSEEKESPRRDDMAILALRVAP